MTPVFLIVLWSVSGLLAAHGTFYPCGGFAFAELRLRAFAALAWLIPQLQRIGPLRLACYLVQVHVAQLDAGPALCARESGSSSGGPSVR